jgi:hypothetical protein
MPLAIGNTWEYSTTFFDAAGNVNGTSLDTTFIQNTSQIGGETFDFVRHYSPPNLPSATGYENKADGLWVHQEGEAMMPYNMLSIPYPIAANVVIKQTSPFSSEVVLLSADTVISVPRGSFHALKYQRNYLNEVTGNAVFRDVLYYSVNVGLIYSEYYIISEDGQLHLNSKSSLLQYSLH